MRKVSLFLMAKIYGLFFVLFSVFISSSALASADAPMRKLSDLLGHVKMEAVPSDVRCDLTKFLAGSPGTFPYFTPCAPGRALSIVEFSLPEDRDDLLRLLPFLSTLATRAAERAQKNNFVKGKTLSEFILETDYMESRFLNDEPAGGFIVFEHTNTQTFPTGFLMFNEFATWSRDLTFSVYDEVIQDSALTKAIARLQKKVVFVDRTQEFEHLEIPRLCELSLLIGLGNGGALMRLFFSRMQAQSKYYYIVLDALAVSESFYERLGFRRVGAQALAIFGKKRGSPRIGPYYHYRNPLEIIPSTDSPALLMVKRIWDHSDLMADEVLNTEEFPEGDIF